MNYLKRIILATAAAALVAGLCVSAQAKEWRGWNIHVAGYPNTVAMDKFAELLKEKSGGRLTVKMYHSGTLGSQPDAIEQLRIGGRLVGPDLVATADTAPTLDRGGSCLGVVMTDIPLDARQCERVARRVGLGLARTGSVAHHGSGDIFLAFATGNHIPNQAQSPTDVSYLPNRMMNPLFYATVEAVEEAILNALTAAETLVGFQGRTAHALPLDRLQALLRGRRILG